MNSNLLNPMRKSTFHAGRLPMALRQTAFLLLLFTGWQGAQAQNCTMACNDLVQFSLDEDCYSEVQPDHILEAGYTCLGPKTVTVMGGNGQPIPGSPWVSGDYIGQTLTVKVTHDATGNHCWGSILVEDKMPPVPVCEDIEVWCNEADVSPWNLGFPDVTDNCDIYPQLFWNDELTDYACGVGNYSAVITRTWTAVDIHGNSGTCVQTISFLRATLGDVAFPLNRDDVAAAALLCGNPDTHPNNTGWPTVNGDPVGGYCDLVATYTDQSTSMCQGNLTIFRTWTVMDMCSGALSSQVQVIKVLDKLGPALTCPTDPEHQVVVLNYLSGPQYNGCLAVVRFPQIQITDNCSSYAKLTFSLTTTINGFVYSIPTNGGILTLPLGTHVFTYKATDDCGNANTCTFTYTVTDKVPPVVACETLHTVAMSSDTTLVEAITFDDGSYDACGTVTFTARRMDNPKCPGDDSTPLGPTVPFFCCDINNGPVMVTLRVTDAAGNWNECMTIVEVADKVPPTIWCPKDITVACGMPIEPTDPITYSTSVKPNQNISSVFAFTYQIPIDVNGLPTDAEIIDLDLFLNIEHEYLDQLRIRLISPEGTLVRIFDGGGVCGIGQEDILATFNDEGNPFVCAGGSPAITGNVQSQADLLSFLDGEGLNTIGSGPGKKTWILEVEDTAPLGGGRINEVGLLFTYGSSLALRPKVHDNTEACGITVTWEDLDPMDKCPGNTIRREWKAADAFGHTATCIQYLTQVDETPWDVTFPADITIEDCTDLNDLTNLGEVTHNGDCEMVGLDYVDQVFTVVPDACYKIERTWYVVDWCKYDKFGNNTNLGIYLDTLQYRDNGDGYFQWVQVIKVLDTTAPKIFCPNDVTILNNEPNCGPTYANLDDVVVIDCSPKIKATISVDLYNDGSINVVKEDLNASGEYPNGVHRIHFKVEDGCNNFTTCSFLLTVVDGKKPQASCRDINIDLMAMNGGGMAQITAAMINLASTDNCTPAHKLLLSVTPEVFTCDELGPNEVQLTVTDEAGNFDVCFAIVNVQDNMNVCPGNLNGTIQGFVKDATLEAVEDVEVTIDPVNGLKMMTGNNGFFQFANLNAGQGYLIQPMKDDNPLNGVSTYDILLIQKHLLGIKALSSPYRIISADVNRSENISVADIIDLRKSLLNAAPFANNTSWRFIPSDYVFANPFNPLKEAWPEHIEIKSLPETGWQSNFTGIKVGDVSGDATPHSLLGAETRNMIGEVIFETEDQELQAGDYIEMPVRASDLEGVEGFQFTLAFDPATLRFAGVKPGQLAGIGEDNFGTRHVDQGYLNVSWNGNAESAGQEVLFTIAFHVQDRGRLSEKVSLHSQMLRAEAYDKEGELMQTVLRFAGESGTWIASEGLQLYQNRPNPFREETIIGFELPQAGRATMTFTDVSGRVLRILEGDFQKGYNEFRIQRQDIQTAGLVWYRLTADGMSATRRMMIME